MLIPTNEYHKDLSSMASNHAIPAGSETVLRHAENSAFYNRQFSMNDKIKP